MDDPNLIVYTNVVFEDTPYLTSMNYLVIEGVPHLRIEQEAASKDRPDDVVLLPVAMVQKTLQILKGH